MAEDIRKQKDMAMCSHIFQIKILLAWHLVFRGCGLSEGIFEESNLKDRLVDAESALKSFKEITGLTDSQIFLWGSSMGRGISPPDSQVLIQISKV